MKKVQPYCMDTSSLISAWDERYPPDLFPPLWKYFADALEHGRMLVPDLVMEELKKKSTDLHDWLKDFPDAIVPMEPEIQKEGRAILGKFPNLVKEHKAAFAADPFVIATAKVKGGLVVTEESLTSSLTKPKIPLVCQAWSVESLRLLEMIRAEAWIIGTK